MSLAAALTQGFRTAYEGRLDAKNNRPSIYGALDLFKAQNADMGSILSSSDREIIKRSFGNTVTIPVLDTGIINIRNVRACTVPLSENNANLVTLVFATFAFGFTMTPSQHANNDISYQEDFNKKLQAHLIKLADTLDSAAVNKLNADRNQYFPAAMSAFYPVVGNALQVSAADTEDAFNQLHAVMATADFTGPFDVLSSTTGMGTIDRLKAQGTQNGVNQAFQFAGLDFRFSNRVINNAGIRNTMFALPKGTVAFENRNDPDAVAGRKIAGVKEWSTEMMPIVNLEMGVYFYADCADMSALHAGTAGLTRTYVEGFEYSTDVCFITAYNGDRAGTYSPIVKVEVSAT